MSSPKPEICPHCNFDNTGENIYQVMLKQCNGDEARALERATMYSGFKEYGLENCFSNRIGIYDWGKDRTIKYVCGNCKGDL